MEWRGAWLYVASIPILLSFYIMLHMISLASLPNLFFFFLQYRNADRQTNISDIHLLLCIELTKKLHIRLDKAKNWKEAATHETIYHPDRVDSCGNVGR